MVITSIHRTIQSKSALKVWAAAGLCIAVLSGCHQDMWNGGRLKPLEQATFFASGSSAQPFVDGTVPFMARRVEEPALYAWRTGGQYAKEFPMPITEEVIQRGQQRFNIYCSPCHDYTGYGNGLIVKRGMKQAASFHQDRLRDPNLAPPGYFVDVITNGFGVMYGYATRIPVEDRWAIAAYIQALQLSQHATLADMPESERSKLLNPQAEPQSEEHATTHAN
ncbi:MAG: hypothetical protein AMXMBFR84_43330 [Candidatus Hydrogenedentota bacterium]